MLRRLLPKLRALATLREPSSAVIALLFTNFVAALLVAIAYAERRHGPEGPSAPAFWLLFARYEVPGALLLLAIGVAAQLTLALPTTAWAERLAAWLSRRLAVAVGAVGVAAATIAVWAYRAYPLSMDEYAPYFQSQVFASGRLYATWPARWLTFGIAANTRESFLDASMVDGHVMEKYWPGFALILTPFTALGVPWLANPLLAALGLAIACRLAQQLGAGASAPGWVAIAMASSAVFIIQGSSFYAMTAHLALNALFAWLLSSPDRPRVLLAGVVGSVALSLHNPLPHAVFAVPWIISMACRPRGLKAVARLAIGYLPGTLLLVVGWSYLRGVAITQAPTAPLVGYTSINPFTIARAAFVWPDAEVLYLRAIDVARVFLWAMPGLPFLAVVGAWLYRRERVVRCLVGSAALTFVAYLFFPYSQGHGWGARYLHSAWFVMPVLAGLALAHERMATLRGSAIVAATLSAVVAVPQRALQVREFIGEHLAMLPTLDFVAADQWPVVFIVTGRRLYDADLVQNSAALDKAPWLLESAGEDDDRAFLLASFPTTAKLFQTEDVTVWTVPRASVETWRATWTKGDPR